MRGRKRPGLALRLLAALCLLALALTSGPRPARAATSTAGVVRVIVFWAEGCGHCHEVLDGVLPDLQQQYGPQLEVRLVEVVSLEDISAFFAVAEGYGYARGKAAVPFVLIGDRALMGVEQIEQHLPDLVAAALAAGGADWPAVSAATTDPPAALPDGACDFTVPCKEETAAASQPSADRQTEPGAPRQTSLIALALGLAATGAAALIGRAILRKGRRLSNKA